MGAIKTTNLQPAQMCRVPATATLLATAVPLTQIRAFLYPLQFQNPPPPLAEKVTSSRPPTHCVGSMLTLCCASVTLCWVVSKRWDPLSPTAHTAEMEANAPHADIQTKPVVSQNVRRVSIILVNYQLAKNTGSFVQPLIQCLYLM